MLDIKWEEPPADGRRQTRWDLVAAALRERPGEWAMVKENTSSSTAVNISLGRLISFRPAGAFEARSVKAAKEGGERRDVYARFVGEGEVTR